MTCLMKVVSAVFLSLVAFLAMVTLTKASDRFARIVGGQETSSEDANFMIYIYKEVNKIYTFCGGTLITPTCVLTAAHCLEHVPTNAISVRGGNPRVRRREEIWAKVSSYRIPTNYKDFNDMDVAVLKLDKPLRAEDVQITSLDFTDVRDKEIISVFGWGRMSEAGEDSENLRKVDMTVLPRAVCWRMGTKNNFCAYEKGKGPCGGDSGGPAMRNGKQVGIVSWGGNCDHSINVFTNLASPAISQFVKATTEEICDTQPQRQLG